MKYRTLSAFPSLAAMLATAGFVRMDDRRTAVGEEAQIEQHETRIREMSAKVDQLEADNEAIFAAADEKREELSAEDQKTVDSNLHEIEALTGDVKRRQAQLDRLRTKTKAAARLSDPEPSEDDEDQEETRTTRSATRGDPRAARPRRGGDTATPSGPTLRDGRELMGFKSGAHFLEDVKLAANGHMSQDLRSCMVQMQRRMDANVTFGEDGAFPVPPDVANDVKKKIDSSADLVGLCDRWTTSADRYTWFLDEQEPWSNANGISGQWLDEGQTIATSSNKLTKVQTDLHKYAVAVPATHEIMRSASQMEQLIRQACPAHIAETLNSVILRGDGVGKPFGIFNSGVLAVQAKESGQAAATIQRKNVTGVHNKVHPSCRNSPAFRWVANIDAELQLEELKGDDNRALYLPGGGYPNLADKPFDTLRGRPLTYSPHASALGDVGDLAAIDFAKYLVIFGENLRQDFSLHVRFLSDEGVFRFIIHVGGRPKWGRKIIEPNSVVQRSFAAAIEQRA